MQSCGGMSLPVYGTVPTLKGWPASYQKAKITLSTSVSSHGHGTEATTTVARRLHCKPHRGPGPTIVISMMVNIQDRPGSKEAQSHLHETPY